MYYTNTCYWQIKAYICVHVQHQSEVPKYMRKLVGKWKGGSYGLGIWSCGILAEIPPFIFNLQKNHLTNYLYCTYYRDSGVYRNQCGHYKLCIGWYYIYITYNMHSAYLIIYFIRTLTVYTMCLGQPTSLGQCTMWPQNTFNFLDNLHACFYIP